jgi:serine/threonine-protein kinase
MVGKILNSRYELEQLIGTGGMADVYRARDNLLGRTVAVKILHPQYAKDEVFIARFRQEAQAAANLNQPNIVNVYDWGIENSIYYLVMEYVEGRDLKDIIQQGGPLLPERAVEIAMSICLALEAAHAYGIVHRDIKPHNVIVTYDNQIKVMDFGIARVAGGSAMTQTGTIMGTAQYISPEQAQGRPADPRSDLYSLGVVIYEMLTGKVPFDGENPVSIAYKHVREDPLPPSMINPDISPGLEAVVMKALAKNPENRYQTAMEMYSDLERCLEGAPVYATPVLPRDEAAVGATRAFPAVAARPKRSLLWLWITLIALVVLAGIGIGIWALVHGSGGVQVPDVTGKTVAQATQTLTPLGLKLSVTKQVIDASKPKGTIVSQNPGAGEKLEKDGTVEVTVSQGTQTVSVPNVVGLTQDQAAAALTAVGLKQGDTTQAYSSVVESGKVVSQSPNGGQQASKGSQVSLVVSKGSQMISVPNVNGMAQDAATQSLTSAGFKADVQTQNTSDTTQVGRVLNQSPAAGEMIAKGATVTIVVGKAPATVNVANVVGQTKASATSTLQSQGFTVNVTDGDSTSAAAKVGTVQSQDPAPGNPATVGSTVTITVYIQSP